MQRKNVGQVKPDVNKELSYRKAAPLYSEFARPARTGMTNGAGGFTLIELLVVVLIIGILAAVAVPQYQKAVLKTRMSSILAMMKTIKEAEERYYLANGVYVDDITQLDIDVPAGDVNGNLSSGHACYKNGTCFDNITDAHDASGWVIVGGIGSSSQDTTSDTCFFTLYFDHSTKPGVIECGKARSRHPQCSKLCKSMGYE